MLKQKLYASIILKYSIIFTCGIVAASLSGGAQARLAQQGQGQQSMPVLSLNDTDGNAHTWGEWKGKRAAVLFFIHIECPLSAGYSPEINRISQAYSAIGFAFYAVESEPTTAASSIPADRYREFNYSFPILLDPEQRLAKSFGITVTPEVAVVTADGKVLYRGRIDDRYVSLDKYRQRPKRQDLRLALDAVVKGRETPAPFPEAVGCFLLSPVNDDQYE